MAGSDDEFREAWHRQMRESEKQPWRVPVFEEGCGCGKSSCTYAQPDPRCVCGKPLFIVIPAGQHIHPCPVHPEHAVFGGPSITC